MRLLGRAILVTGAATGIGRAICLRLRSEGAKVGCADIDAAGAADTAAALGEDGLALHCDVTDPDSGRRAVEHMQERFGSLFGLINNAAAKSVGGSVVDVTLEDWRREIDVSLTGAFLMSKFAVPAIARSGGGCIVHVGSQFARVAVAGSPAYCAAKAGLVHLAKAMALDHAGQNIRVNSLSPGAVATPRLVQGHGSLAAAERVLVPKHPLGRLARADEIAAVAAFLMSDEASFITGSDLLADGGYSAA